MSPSCYLKSAVGKHRVSCLLLVLVSLFGAPVGRGQSKAALLGVISDAFGAKVSGTFVTLHSPDRVLQTTSGQVGQFEFADLPPDTYDLEINHPGFKKKIIEAIRITDKTGERLSIILDIGTIGCDIGGSATYEKDLTQSGRTLIGRVLDSNQRSLREAKVQLLNLATQAQASQRSGVKGEFIFADLEPGRYTLKLSRAGYHDRGTESFWITRENQTRITVPMLRLGLIIVCE
jgi:hypothetical protein